MKIAIITFHYAHNYGAMLQAYALKTYIESLGGEVCIINYVPEYMKIKYYHMKKEDIFRNLSKTIIKLYIKRRKNIRRFDEFEKYYLKVDKRNIINEERLTRESSKYDYIIFGSDQIWNTNLTMGDKNYFCGFTNPSKAIAYAASCGDAINTKKFDEMVSNFVCHYKAISVRENNAWDILKNIYRLNVEQVLDPVFLIEPSEWIKLSESAACTAKGEYVFYYALEDNANLKEECKEYAFQNNLRIMAAHGEMKKSIDSQYLLNGVGPIEFLYLIRNAKCVFTNSFHAAAFSLIFGKKAYIRVHSQTGNRIVDLLSNIGIQWNGVGLFILEEQERGNVIDDIAKTSKDFLKGAFDI